MLINISLTVNGVFIHTPKSKLVSLQDTSYSPENSCLLSAELSVLMYQKSGKKTKRTEREVGAFQIQQGSRTSLNLSRGRKALGRKISQDR